MRQITVIDSGRTGRRVSGTKVSHDENNSEMVHVDQLQKHAFDVTTTPSVDDIETLVHHHSNLTAKIPLSYSLPMPHCTPASAERILRAYELQICAQISVDPRGVPFENNKFMCDTYCCHRRCDEFGWCAK